MLSPPLFWGAGGHCLHWLSDVTWSIKLEKITCDFIFSVDSFLKYQLVRQFNLPRFAIIEQKTRIEAVSIYRYFVNNKYTSIHLVYSFSLLHNLQLIYVCRIGLIPLTSDGGLGSKIVSYFTKN